MMHSYSLLVYITIFQAHLEAIPVVLTMVKVMYLLQSEMLAVLLQVKVFYLAVILLVPLVALTVRMLVLIVMVSYL